MSKPDSETSTGRRRFVQGLLGGGALAGLGLRPAFSTASEYRVPQTLRGQVFDLHLRATAVDYTGHPAIATTINDTLPGPVLVWREGERVTLRVHNHLPVDSSIHWHGILLPDSMDGVPHISSGFRGITPGTTFTYHFDVRQSGTYWYHSHSGFQEQTGLYGAIVIQPRTAEDPPADRDYVILMSDWTDEQPMQIYSRLKKLSHYYNRNERTVQDLLAEIREQGIKGTLDERRMWNQMRMSDRDLSDVTGYTYTFLMNGIGPAPGWVGLFRRGEKVRLRFINASAMTFFDVRIPGLTMKVVACDGQEIEAVTIDEFRLGVAETLDVLVEPNADSAYTIFAQAIDRSGYALGTLTPDPDWRAQIPAMDPVPVLSHADMGMAHGDGAHIGHDMGTLDHSQHIIPADAHAGHKAPALDHSQHRPSQDAHAGHGMSTMDHSQHAMPTVQRTAGRGSTAPIVHAASEYGPEVDMRAEAPRQRLDDPGVGLRNNGRRVFTYADMFNRYPTPDPREPGREIQLHLTGNMHRYMWSINGIRFADAEPLPFLLGERLRITLVNDTMMHHPIHLHGMWSDLETGEPDRIPRKHTVVVQPGARISYLVTADAPGAWAYHCHLLYHMPGMFRTVTVREG